MTVQELIELLQSQDPTRRVVFDSPDGYVLVDSLDEVTLVLPETLGEALDEKDPDDEFDQELHCQAIVLAG